MNDDYKKNILTLNGFIDGVDVRNNKIRVFMDNGKTEAFLKSIYPELLNPINGRYFMVSYRDSTEFYNKNNRIIPDDIAHRVIIKAKLCIMNDVRWYLVAHEVRMVC